MLGGRYEQQVTSGMSKCVVDFLEMVQIDIENREPAGTASRGGESLLEPFDERRTVGEPRERIGPGEDYNFIRSFFFLRDIS